MFWSTLVMMIPLPFDRRLKPVDTQLKGKKRNLKRLQKLRNKGNLATPNNLPIGQVFYKKLNHLRAQGERKLRGELSSVYWGSAVPQLACWCRSVISMWALCKLPYGHGYGLHSLIITNDGLYLWNQSQWHHVMSQKSWDGPWPGIPEISLPEVSANAVLGEGGGAPPMYMWQDWPLTRAIMEEA